MADQLMSEEHKKVLTRHLDVLVDNMTCTSRIVDGLVAQEIFDHRETVHEDQGEYNRRVVYRLMQKSDKGYFVFLRELQRTNQPALANRLDKDIANPEQQTTTVLNRYRSVADEVEKLAGNGSLSEYQSREVISTTENLKEAVVAHHRSKFLSVLNQAPSDWMSMECDEEYGEVENDHIFRNEE